MKWKIVLIFIMVGLCGCGSDTSKNESAVETQGNDKSAQISSIEKEESKPEAEVKMEQKEEAPDSGQLLMDYYQDEIISKRGKIKNYELTAGYVRRELEPVYDSEWVSFTQVDVGDYSGEEGVLAMELTDMDSDGSDEMVVFYREKDKVSDWLYKNEEIETWKTGVEVFYVDDGEVKSSGAVILDEINSNDENRFSNYRASSVEARFYYAELADGKRGVAVNSIFGPPMWADGIRVYLAVYSYEDHQLKEVGYEAVEGSDIGEYVGYDVVKKAGFDHTVKKWKDVSEGDYIEDFFLPEDEPAVKEVFRYETVNNMDWDASSGLYENDPKYNIKDYHMNLEVYGVFQGMRSLSELGGHSEVTKDEDASSDVPMSGKTEETAYGNRIFIPDGFVDITEYYDGYESNNAAGGVTWTLYNEQLDMTIDISEYPYPLVYDMDGFPNQVLMGEYDFYRQSYGETDLNEAEGYFITVWSDTGNKKNKLKYIVDNICHTVTVTYPENKEQEYSAIRDKVINSFEVVGQ